MKPRAVVTFSDTLTITMTFWCVSIFLYFSQEEQMLTKSEGFLFILNRFNSRTY